MAGTPLENLLQTAYTILQEHYQKVNHDEMKKYLPDTSESAKPSPPADRQIQTVTRQTVDLSKIFCGRKLATLNTARTTPRISPPTSGRSASSASASGSSSNNESPLTTHTVLLDLFQGLLMDKDGDSIDLTPYRDDKLFDQFDGNCVIVEEKTANDSGETKDGKKTGDEKKTGDGKKKRKSRESDDCNPQPAKYRQPRTQNHGYQVNFDKS